MIKLKNREGYNRSLEIYKWGRELQNGVGVASSQLTDKQVRTKYNGDYFCLVRFAFTPPFLQVNQKLSKTPRVLNVIHSFVHPFNRTRVHLDADRDHLFSRVSVQLFGAHPSAIAVFTPAQKIRTKWGNEFEFNSNLTKQDMCEYALNNKGSLLAVMVPWQRFPFHCIKAFFSGIKVLLGIKTFFTLILFIYFKNWGTQNGSSTACKNI